MATAALTPQRAHAQAFQGRINSSVGTVTRTNTTPTSETITIGSPTATINWTPTGQPNGNGNLDFLPSGNIATFQGDVNAGNYTVLNRIIPGGSTPIELNGTVNSFLSDNSTGGNIWFYSPNGILIGAGAVFNVGGLLLTTADPGSNWSTSSNGFAATAPWVAAPGSFVTVSNGAQINAQNNYVAIIAPKVTQAGTVNVNGSAAYVAADQVTMTLNQGLFDIAVDVGTDDPNGIIHSGTTTGAANVTAADNHSIYMVAVPKNSALTMLLQGGRVGFGNASSASVQNGQIILSAGYGVSHDSSGTLVFNDPGLAVTSNIDITAGKFSSSVLGLATGKVQATGGGNGTLEFDGNAAFQGLSSATLTAKSGDTITVGGNLSLGADDLKGFVGTGSDIVDAHGGSATILAETGGTIKVTGNVTVTANASPTVNIDTSHAGTSTGGTAKIDADGGSITIGGNATIQANAFADTSNSGFDGRNSYGGDADLYSSIGGSVSIGGNLQMNADGFGSPSGLASAGTGGTGYGGSIDFSADDGGSVSVAGTSLATVNGYGGGVASADGIGGRGQGGTATIAVAGTGSLSFNGDVDVDGLGKGGDAPGQGGVGSGGYLYVRIDGGTIVANNKFGLYADGSGGTGAPGGDGFGGFSEVIFSGIEGSSRGGSLKVGTLALQADGSGGAGAANASGTGAAGGAGTGGGTEFYTTSDLLPGATISAQFTDAHFYADGTGGTGGGGIDGGAGGQGSGGSTSLDLNGGTVTGGTLVTSSTGFGGAGGAATTGTGGAGGDAFGGDAEATIGNSVTLSSTDAFVSAVGGSGGSGATAGNGGSANAGYAIYDIVAGGQFNGSVNLWASALGGNGANGGEGDGGFGWLLIEGSLTAPSVTLDSSGTGGTGISADGGYSLGGSSELIVDGGVAHVTGGLTLRANGNNSFDESGNVIGASGAANGGDADGGGVLIDVDSGSLTVGGATDLTARGAGGAGGAGSGGIGGNGGYGNGGGAQLYIGTCGATCAPASASLQSLSFNTNGRGGAGGSSTTGGTGGDGTGGGSSIDVIGGTLTTADTVVGARGFAGNGGAGTGGNGGAGGQGFGGSDTLDIYSGASMTGSTFVLQSTGQGGNGGAGSNGFNAGNGGSATGGYSDALIDGSATFGGSATAFNGFVATAFAQGGDGANGGAASGGESFIDVTGSLTVAGLVQTTARSLGGAGSAGAGGIGYGGYAADWMSGSLNAGAVLVATDGTGGNGSTIGGAGTGGYSSFDVAGSSTIGSGGTTVQAPGWGGNGPTGGEGEGGSATVSVEGTFGSSSLLINASGTGGMGSSGNGGSSLGGYSGFLVTDGGANIAGDLTVKANANDLLDSNGNVIGASGSADGGSADGGSATIDVDSGSLTVGGATVIAARAVGGNGGSGNGGYGQGGSVSFSLSNFSCSATCSPSATFRALSLNGNGRGGNGGNAAIGGTGGFGAGGETTIDISAGAVSAVDIGASAQGFGGNGGAGSSGAGGDGGVGHGGDTSLNLSASLTAASFFEVAHGTGGNGGGGTTGAGNGGSGIGGQSDADIALGGSGSFMGGGDPNLAGVFRISAAGIGGDGASGGSAIAGFADLTVEGSLADNNFLQVTGQAVGGAGSAGAGGNAGNSDGEASLYITGSVNSPQLVLGSGAFAGSGTTGLGQSQAGSASLTVDGGTLNLGAFGSQVQADALVLNGTTPTGTAGSANVSAINSGKITTADLTVSASGNTGTGSVAVGANSSGTIAAGDLSLISSNDLDMLAVGTDITVSGKLDLESEQNIVFADVTAGSFSFDAGGTVTGGKISVGNHVDGSAQGAITLGDISAGPGLPTNSSDFSVGIVSATSIATGNVTGAGNVGFASLGGLTTGNITSGDLFMAFVSGNLTTGSITTASAGRAYIANASMFTAAGGPDNFDPSAVLSLDPVATGGSITLGGPVSTGTLQAAAGTSFTAGNITTGSPLVLSAGGLATFNGTVSAPHITVTSHDIDIAAGASLGVHGVTSLITLNAISDQPVLIGALPGSAGQYVLNEAGNLASDALVVNALPASGATAPNINVGAVTIDGSLTSGGGFSSVSLNTGGSILVEGAVNYSNAGPTDSLVLNAGRNVEVNTNSGSIAMTNGSALAGSLTLAGANIWVADQAILTKLEQDPTSVGAAELATNGGTSKPDGYVSANGVTANVGSSFLVQNSGTADDLGGITVGDGGLTINAAEAATGFARPAAATTPSFDVYGRQHKSDGTVVTGSGFAAVVKASGSFTTTSSVNGCPVGGCPPPPPPPPPSPPPPPAQPSVATASDQVLGPIESTDSATGEDQQAEEDKKKDKGSDEDEGVNAALRLINTGPINLDQQIDEPVTSGNDVEFDLGPPPGTN